MSTAANLTADVRKRLADEDDMSYGDSLIRQFLSEGSSIFAGTTGCCQTTHDFTTDGSAATLSLTTMTYQWVAVYNVTDNGTELSFAPRHEAVRWGTAVSGTAAGYSMWGDTLYLDAIPDADRTVQVYYTYIPDELSASSDTVLIPVKWETAIVAYAEYRCRAVDRETGLADRAYAEFESLRISAQQIYNFIMGGR